MPLIWNKPMLPSETPSQAVLDAAMRQAIELARDVEGRTAPNPPVGAVALDAAGNILGGWAHQGAGLPHAEAGLIAKLHSTDQLSALHTMVVTLEPCSHFGRTPPCAQALINAGAKQVLYGSSDPTPKAAGGHGVLSAAGIDVQGGFWRSDCDQVNAAFTKYAATGMPWIVIKRAFRKAANGAWTMIPERADTTFTRPNSLKRAHEIRRSCDGILTGSGTVLADNPSFTVRHVKDHSCFASGEKKRSLAVLDRRHRVDPAWLKTAGQTFDILQATSAESGLKALADQNCMKVLVEAGPSLSDHLINVGLWDEIVDFYHHEHEDEERVTLKAQT
jgi:diaminohydroxyphosphoribosylaminopyrimidine deaminase/5-amino-6-(5-phosphoribosylamino)uracil reductase